MFITEEDQEHHIMLGEAAMSLIFNREVISPAALLQQLQTMAVAEDDDARVLQIWKTRKWLVAQNVHQTLPDSDHWRCSSDSQNDPEARDVDMRLRPSPSDKAEK